VYSAERQRRRRGRQRSRADRAYLLAGGHPTHRYAHQHSASCSYTKHKPFSAQSSLGRQVVALLGVGGAGAGGPAVNIFLPPVVGSKCVSPGQQSLNMHVSSLDSVHENFRNVWVNFQTRDKFCAATLWYDEITSKQNQFVELRCNGLAVGDYFASM
jgi:hypothetical protein